MHGAAAPKTATRCCGATASTCVILDITLPGKSGIAWLKELREQGYAGEVVLITAFADLDTAIEALRAGASDFILKPFRVTQILNAVQHGLERARLQRENWVLRRALSQRTPPADGLVGRSIAIKGLQAALQRVARGQQHGAADRRIGHRQGTGRARAAPPEPARGGALRAGELRHRVARA